MPELAPLIARARLLRQRSMATVASGGFTLLSQLGRITPWSTPGSHGLERIADLPYGDLPIQKLDIYRQRERSEPLPVVLYVHGGGFRAMSKETHWLMGLAFARRGAVVFNVDYRLAPRHPFPAAALDVCAALRWVIANAASYGGDPTKLVIAGESAGANLASVLAIACCYQRPEPWARAVFELGVVPRVVLPACGLLQVSDPERLMRRKPIRWMVQDMLRDPAHVYVPKAAADIELVDPLVVLERGEPPDRPLPPFFLPVGTRDPLLDDTRRMKAALDRLGASAEARYYPGEVHAFHAMIWRSAARACWREMLAFTERHTR